MPIEDTEPVRPERFYSYQPARQSSPSAFLAALRRRWHELERRGELQPATHQPQ